MAGLEGGYVVVSGTTALHSTGYYFFFCLFPIGKEKVGMFITGAATFTEFFLNTFPTYYTVFCLSVTKPKPWVTSRTDEYQTSD